MSIDGRSEPFLPGHQPEVRFSPLCTLRAHPESLWGAAIGALASTFLTSPNERAAMRFEERGSHRLRQALARGFAVTADLCTGEIAAGLGTPAPGRMLATAKASQRITRARLAARGLLLFGPYRGYSGGLRVTLDVSDGPGVRARLFCLDVARQRAQAFNSGRWLPEPPASPTSACAAVRL